MAYDYYYLNFSIKEKQVVTYTADAGLVDKQEEVGQVPRPYGEKFGLSEQVNDLTNCFSLELCGLEDNSL